MKQITLMTAFLVMFSCTKTNINEVINEKNLSYNLTANTIALVDDYLTTWNDFFGIVLTPLQSLPTGKLDTLQDYIEGLTNPTFAFDTIGSEINEDLSYYRSQLMSKALAIINTGEFQSTEDVEEYLEERYQYLLNEEILVLPYNDNNGLKTKTIRGRACKCCFRAFGGLIKAAGTLLGSAFGGGPAGAAIGLVVAAVEVVELSRDLVNENCP